MNKPNLNSIRETHPYDGGYWVDGAKIVIVGSFPNIKFTDQNLRKQIKTSEIDFFYGGEKNLLWTLIGKAFTLPLDSKEKIQAFLIERSIAVSDVVRSCVRELPNSADKHLKEIEWNTSLQNKLIGLNHPRLVFTSKTVEKWFIKNIFPQYPGKTEAIPSPSQAANLGIGKSPEYKEWVAGNSNTSLENYRIYRYKNALMG